MVSILLGVWNGGGVWCLLSCLVQWCGSCPTRPTAVLASIAVRVVHCSIAGCGVWVVCVCLWCSCGGVSSVHPPPRRGGGWGHCGWWGAVVVVGGIVSEGRQCYWLPVECWRPPFVCWRPPCRLPCGPIEWRGGVVMPCLRIGSGSLHCPAPFVLSSPPSSFVFAVTALLV